MEVTVFMREFNATKEGHLLQICASTQSCRWIQVKVEKNVKFHTS